MHMLHPIYLDFCMSTSSKGHALTCFQSNMAIRESKLHQSLIMLIHVGEERNRPEHPQLLAWINAVASRVLKSRLYCRCLQHLNWFIDWRGISHVHCHATSRWMCPIASGCVIYSLGSSARSQIYLVFPTKGTIAESFFSSPSWPIAVLVVSTWYLHRCCNSYIFKGVHVSSSYAITPLTSINPA